MEIIEFQKNCLAILYEMCQKFDLEAVFNLEKMTGEGSDREQTFYLFQLCGR